MKPIYWDNINSCLSELRYDGGIHILLPQHTDLSTYRMCGRGHNCNPYGYTLSLYGGNLKLYDCRIRPTWKDMKRVAGRLREMGLLQKNEGWGDFHKHLIRVFYNPSPELMETILKERARIGAKTNQIGAHVRCGGVLADTTERTAMVTPKILATIPNKIKRLTRTSHVPKNDAYLYLSTDSTIAYNTISKALHPMRVVTSDLYHRGHTTTHVKSGSIKRAYIDLYLVSESRHLLLMSRSSFSRIIQWMSGAKYIKYVKAPYSFVNVTYGDRKNTIHSYPESGVVS